MLFIPDKGAKKNDLADLRREICDRFVTQSDIASVEFDVPAARPKPAPSYGATVDDWHEAIAAIYESLIRDELARRRLRRLPGLGRSFALRQHPAHPRARRAAEHVAFEFEVIPGITSVQALAAGHKIALNRIGDPVQITTGRRLAERACRRMPTDVVVMLDGKCAFNTLADEDVDIYWGAYLGTPDEILISGRLGDVGDEIEQVREEARASEGLDHGHLSAAQVGRALEKLAALFQHAVSCGKP